jgi:hypothetical protein
MASHENMMTSTLYGSSTLVQNSSKYHIIAKVRIANAIAAQAVPNRHRLRSTCRSNKQTFLSIGESAVFFMSWLGNTDMMDTVHTHSITKRITRNISNSAIEGENNKYAWDSTPQ